MPYRNVRSNTAARLSELQIVMSLLKNNDLIIPRPPENQIIKGLFVVQLYAFMEFSVKEITQTAVSTVNSANVLHKHLTPSLFPLISEPIFKSAAEQKGDKKWRRRYEITTSINSTSRCVINNSAFSGEMSNTKTTTIEILFDMFGLKVSPYHDAVISTFIDEIAEGRNAVAHGRESPAAVGGRYTVSELEQRYNSFNQQITYMIFSFESMSSSKSYIKPVCRKMYP